MVTKKIYLLHLHVVIKAWNGIQTLKMCLMGENRKKGRPASTKKHIVISTKRKRYTNF